MEFATEELMSLDKFFDVLINKLHIALGAVVQGAILFYHFHTGHDIGPGIQNTVYAYYAFLLGHAGVYQKYPDKGDPNAG
jgi:hypothetical protein